MTEETRDELDAEELDEQGELLPNREAMSVAPIDGWVEIPMMPPDVE